MSRSRARAGRPTNAPPQDQPWVWLSQEMVGSVTFRALSLNARRVLDFLIYEQMGDAGRENGRLGASYRQLDAWGVTRNDITSALEELMACGFIRRTEHGLRQAGGGDPSRFALTWLPTMCGSPEAADATHDWRRTAIDLHTAGVRSVTQTRAWLRETVAPKKRGATPRTQPVSPPERNRLVA